MAGGRRAAGPRGSVGDLTGRPEAVRLDARRVRAAVAGGGVPGQALVVRHAARTAAAGSAALVQVVHVQFQSVADVRLPVLLLLCGSATHTHTRALMFHSVLLSSLRAFYSLRAEMKEENGKKQVPSFSSRRRTCLRTGCRFM